MAMANIEVLDLPTLSASFPRLVPNTIIRSHVLNGIELYLEGDTDLLFVEGADGIGKTTLLAQYALKNPLTTFSLFVRSTSRWAYDPEILLRDLANQITWLLNKKEIPPDQEIDRSYLRRCFLALQRKAQAWKVTYIFIIDGLEEIPEDSIDVREQILDMLPFGFSGFKFILTGDKEKLSQKQFMKMKSKTFPLIPFSVDETRSFLSGLVDEAFLGEIYKTCKGIPEYLTAIKRLIDGGIDLHNLINELPEKLPDLFEIEWKKIDLQNKSLVYTLGILAHDRKKHYLHNLARVLQVSPEAIEKDLSELRFIVIQSDGEVDFVSESFRKFVIKQLHHLRKQTIDLIIDDLLKNSNSQDSLLLLPSYFNEAERYDDLLHFLSPDYFTRIIEYSGTMMHIRQQATLGVDISKKEGKDIDLLRFSAEKAIILGTDRAKALISELEALMALDDYEKALTLAQSAVLKEDLLQSLAVIAKKKQENDNKIEPELIDQIKNTYNQIDPETLGRRGLEIASVLVFSIPDLAIELVEKSHNKNSEEKVPDWAIAKLSVAAAAASNQNGTNIYEQIRQRITNPKTQNITTAASLILGDCDADQVITESEKFDSPLDGLFMLRLWTSQKREREDAAKVIEHAIKLAIKTSEYTPNARDFRQLASPLPYLKDPHKIKELIAQFDALKGTLIKFGPSEDFVRLQIILAHAERQVDKQASNNRILENYLYFINDLDDLSLKATCIARILVSLERVDPDGELESQDQFHSLVSSDFDATVSELRITTAEHYLVFSTIINALAKRKPNKAYSIAEQLNLESRRNHSYYDIIASHIDQPYENWDFESLRRILSSLSDVEFRDDALLIIFARLANCSEEIAKELINEILPIINITDEVETAPVKCNILGLIYTYLAKVEDSTFEGLRKMIRNKISSSWKSIDDGWIKVNFGFRTSESLALISVEDGRKFYLETEALKREIELNESTTVDVYIACLRLSIRAFIGLLNRNIDAPEDLEQLQFAIDKLPSTSERIRAWSDIASGFVINHRIDDAKKIVNEYIRPNLSQLYGSEKNSWSEIITYIAPVLFSTNQISTFEEIEKLKFQQKDEALSGICQFIFKKTLPFDPYDYTSRKGFDIAYDDVVVILDLISRLKADDEIYGQIEMLADSLSGPMGKNRVTKEQRITITRRLEKIVEDNLPDKRNIVHDGYKIAACSQVYRINTPNSQAWDDLVQLTRDLPNLSDQVFVLGTIAVSMPNKMIDKRKAVLSEAYNLIDKIPALLDRIDRYEALARFSIDIDQEMAKLLLNQGIKAAITRDEPEAFSAQRRLIDFAYSTIGSDFATNLASLADDDPARKRAQRNLTERIRIQKIKYEVIDQKPNENKNASTEESLPRIAWMLLSALNADRIRTFHLEEMRPYIETASTLPIQKSYPIFAWIVQNAIKRFSHTDQARSVIKNMFNALMTSTELSGRIAKSSSDQMMLSLSQSITVEKDDSVIIRAGERAKALSIIRNWVENDVKEYIKINDPYFSLADLELLLLVMEIKPSCKTYISTSKKQQEQDGVQAPWEDAYRSYWKLKLSDQFPPECDIIIVGSEKTGEHPIHDRWWVTDGSGFRMGTSFKSLGIGKDSELSILTPNEAQSREAEIDRFLVRRLREHNGERLAYTLLSL
jgi:hypothetical protein